MLDRVEDRVVFNLDDRKLRRQPKSASVVANSRSLEDTHPTI